MTSILHVEGVALRFGGIVALDAVSLDVRTGELLAIVGPNGAGKTSLLNCIAGAYHATEGRIVFDGADISHAPAHSAIK